MEAYDDADNLTRHIDKVAGVEYNYAYNEQRDVTRVQMSCTYDTLNRPKKSSYKVNGKSYSYTCNYTNYPDETLI